MQCTRVSFASAAEASSEIHLTTAQAGSVVESQRRQLRLLEGFGGKLLVQQMEICDAVSNSCVRPVDSLKQCQLFA